MSLTLSDFQPYLSLAGQVLPPLVQAIEQAIAQHQGGDPNAALDTLNAAIEECGPQITAALAGIQADRKEGDAYEDARFPPSQPLSAAVDAITNRLREVVTNMPAPVLVKDPTP